MSIDLNNPLDFTVENVRKMIASGDNNRHAQIRVDKSGIAFLSKSVGNDGTEGQWAFTVETFSAQSDHVGEAASQNDAWVQTVYDILRDNWPNPTSKHIDDF